MSESTWALAGETRPVRYRFILWQRFVSVLEDTPFYAWFTAVLTAFSTFIFNGLYDWDLPVVVIGFAALIVQSYQNQRKAQHELQADDFELARGVAQRRGWFVDLLILQGEAPTGSDRGLLWIEDDRLFFVGQNTSFGLVSSQAAGRCRWTVPLPGFRNALTLPLAKKTRAGSLAISFSPLMDSRDRPEAAEAVDSWTDLRAAQSGQFPPTTVGGTALPMTGLFVGAMVSTAYWLGLAAFAADAESTLEAAFRIALGALLGWRLDLHYPWLRWRAWSTRRRMG